LEAWVLKSLVLGRPAPVEVATVEIPHLNAIRAGLAVGGMFCPMPAGKIALGLVNVGIGYAVNQGYIACK
jgi:hypothetical protein